MRRRKQSRRALETERWRQARLAPRACERCGESLGEAGGPLLCGVCALMLAYQRDDASPAPTPPRV